MVNLNEVNKIKLVFFSGTGSTARVAAAFEKVLSEQGKSVVVHEINRRNIAAENYEDMLLVIYSVHACNAPEPVYEYIKAIPEVKQKPAVVISVSGGGEVTPNTACRMHCIKRLEKKGYKVIYERMIVMPSNFVVSTIEELAVRLLEVLPHRVNDIVNEVFAGVTRRSKPNGLNKFLSNIGELEKNYTKSFGRKIKVGDNCMRCGWCEEACPRENITLIDGKPSFQDRCLACLKCIYGCPQNALSPGIWKYIVLKQGFDLRKLEKRIGEPKVNSIEELAKGYLWKGIREYLLKDE
jgi:ferredoxin/flavodoxin